MGAVTLFLISLDIPNGSITDQPFRRLLSLFEVLL
jgi:hypothetical protein